MIKQNVAAAGFALLFALSISIAAAKTPEEKALKVGKRGEITLTQATHAGEQILPPASYVVQHRDSGSEHFVHFHTIVTPEPTNESYFYPYVGPVAGEIKCRMESTAVPVTETTVYIVTENGIPRITKVAIKGEMALHVL
jgi:hypothetical protein